MTLLSVRDICCQKKLQMIPLKVMLAKILSMSFLNVFKLRESDRIFVFFHFVVAITGSTLVTVKQSYCD